MYRVLVPEYICDIKPAAMKLSSFLRAFLFLFLFIKVAEAQTYYMSSSGTRSITTCSGKLYDAGGTGYYGRYDRSTIVISPSANGG